jgi:hypothetical protein
LHLTNRIAPKLRDVVAAQHRARRAVGAEVVGVVDVEQVGEPGAGAVDAAFDGADRALANLSGFFIGEA